MATIYIVRTGPTRWEPERRFEPTSGVPLSPEGIHRAESIVAELGNCGIRSVYAGPGEAERQTGALLAKALGVRVHMLEGLSEIDYGMWQGLTLDEIKVRQPKVYKQWSKAPTSVRPPGGETIREVDGRLRRALKEVIRREKGHATLLVLRPVAMGLLRCIVQEEDLDALWSYVDPDFTWGAYETDSQLL
jgi:broad specificity phosphatase PhoE